MTSTFCENKFRFPILRLTLVLWILFGTAVLLKSANKVICVMRRLKFTLSRAALNQIYLAYVRPILEYSSIVWDGCTTQDLNSLEKLQHEAARVVTGLTRSVSLEKL